MHGNSDIRIIFLHLFRDLTDMRRNGDFVLQSFRGVVAFEQLKTGFVYFPELSGNYQVS